jgi:rod shape determining protein RodA
MWTSQYLKRIDFRIIPILLGLMVISLLVIASTTGALVDGGDEFFLTPLVKTQMRWFVLGWLVFLFLLAWIITSYANVPGCFIARLSSY